MLDYFFYTLLIEIPIYFIFVRERITYPVFILFFANMLTWPILNLLYFNTNINLLILESGVTLVEAFIIYIFLNQQPAKALLISFVQNTVSTAIGVYLNSINPFK